MPRSLIDADILVYRIGYTTEDADIEIAKWRMNELVEKILSDTKATSYKLYLTKSKDENAFRSKVYPEYKQNRKAPRPVHYQALREFLVSNWQAEIVEVIEADDALGIEQCNSIDTIICTIDKDLDMIPGWHYNFVKEITYFVHFDEAIRNFYKQVLMGDRADNVKGIEGIGEKKADKILYGSETEEEYFERAREAYGNDEAFLQNGEILWILRENYPHGRWSYTSFGSRLVPKTEPKPELDLKQTELGSESIGEEMLKVGFLQNGINQLDSSTVMDEDLTWTSTYETSIS